VATLPGLGHISDTNGDSSLADERCTADAEAGMEIAWGTLAAADAAAQAVCGGVGTFACIASGATAAAVVANEIAINQCALQDALVDAAEIEATFENSKIIASQNDGISTQVSGVSTQVSGVSTQVSNLSTQVATHDTDIKNDLSTHDTDIKSDLSTHDTDIKNDLSTHDTDVKLLLSDLQAQVQAFQDLALRVEIERALTDNKRHAVFYLPQAQGGQLETVRQIVLDDMNDNQAAGLGIGQAQRWFNRAQDSMNAGDYKDAFDEFAQAYKEVTK
jgi:hypothetical protein